MRVQIGGVSSYSRITHIMGKSANMGSDMGQETANMLFQECQAFWRFLFLFSDIPPKQANLAGIGINLNNLTANGFKLGLKFYAAIDHALDDRPFGGEIAGDAQFSQLPLTTPAFYFSLRLAGTTLLKAA